MSETTLTELRAGRLTGIKRLDLSCALREVPSEVFDLADSLEIFNLSGNRLSDLPDDLPRLRRLRVLFCSDNEFRHVPEVLGRCPALRMIGFKSNRIETLPESALPPGLRWLILTDNRLTSLPASLGNCRDLQKLMRAGNRLERLPEEMAACRNLELIRLAANRLTALPDWLLTLPRLTWLAFAGNPCSTAPVDLAKREIAEIAWSDLELQQTLGQGASGVIIQAAWRTEDGGPRPVAVKVFKGAVTSDGLPSCERDAWLAAGEHPHLTRVLGRITGHPAGADGLVMPLIGPEFTILAGPPSLESRTRDVYPDDSEFCAPIVVKLLTGLASAVCQLHARGILHGDFYGHNILRNANGHAMLGDFGAASFFDVNNPGLATSLQRMETRAFGCLMEELLERCPDDECDGRTLAALRELQSRCCSESVSARPLLAEIAEELRRLGEG